MLKRRIREAWKQLIYQSASDRSNTTEESWKGTCGTKRQSEQKKMLEFQEGTVITCHYR